MLSFIRRITNSRTGVIVSFVVLVLIALAFVGGDVSGLRTAGLTGASGSDAATVGATSLSATELKGRTQEEMQSFRQRQQTLDMAQFVAGGGFEGTLERQINSLAFEQFATGQGLVVSKRLVDGEIASTPGLQGPDGKFSQSAYERLLTTQRITDARIRSDITRDTFSRQLTAPTLGASQVAQQMALPYASLLLEKRTGQIGFIPTRAMGAGSPPTEAELSAYFKRNVARYTIPERRTIRYAIVTPAQFAAAATPGEAEIKRTFDADAAKYAATEKRSLSQVVLPDQATANALIAKLKSGTTLEQAASALGLEAARLTGLERKAYAEQTSPANADAVFSAARGGVVGPLRAPLGWAVVHIDSVEQIAARTLAQVRGDIIKTLTEKKILAALTAVHDRIDDAIGNNATFAEIIGDQKLQPLSTPPVLADGRNPLNPAPADIALADVVKAGFAAEPGDDPQLVSTGRDGSFAVVALDQIIAAAPPPMAQMRDALVRDFVIDRARRAARTVAAAAVAKISKGTSLEDALKQTGLKLPPVQPMAASRASLAAMQKGPPAPLVLLFSMANNTAKLLEAPQQGGWFIIHLDSVERGDAASQTQVIAAMRSDLAKVVGREYIEQFAQALRDTVGVRKNQNVIDEIKRDLLGQSNGQP
ncbi:MAG: SurA N-terminal domain-containing protein [Sphingomonas sp.]|jgi:peptidyl-prolyl cis-trans isomerase D